MIPSNLGNKAEERDLISLTGLKTLGEFQIHLSSYSGVPEQT